MLTGIRAPEVTPASDRRTRPPLAPLTPPVAWALGRCAETVYRAELTRRNRAFDRGIGVVRLDRPVISVGNLSVGGTGKTPMVMRLAEWALDRGATPAIAMRGYKRRANEASDEEAEYRDRLPGVPIVAQPDRAAGLRRLLEKRSDVRLVILDDGFQHRRLARDLDIVLLDATRDPFDDRCLPAGWLREPVESLDRAHVFVLTRCESAPTSAWHALRDRLRVRRPDTPSVIASHTWSALRIAGEDHPVESLEDRPLVVACGIGHPSAFVGAVERLTRALNPGAPTLELQSVIRPDHHSWTPREAGRLAEQAAAMGERALVVCTEKDWVKLAPALQEAGVAELSTRFARPQVRLTFDPQGENAMDDALKRTLEMGG